MASEMSKSQSQDSWERSPGFVYFIVAGDPPVAIKIGVTTQAELQERFRTHQSSNHEPLRLVGVIPFEGGERPTREAVQKEGELHKRFSHLQRFMPGWVGSEWFTAAPELNDFISKHTVPPHQYTLPETVCRPGPGLQK